MSNEFFGFTNDKSKLDAVKAWRDAAVADGWHIQPYFESESMESASRLTKNGFIASILTREPNHKYKYEAKISVWGDDGLAILVPDTYDANKIFSGTTRCNYCKKSGVSVKRVGFAGRCCEECMPEVQKRVERPGWTL